MSVYRKSTKNREYNWREYTEFSSLSDVLNGRTTVNVAPIGKPDNLFIYCYVVVVLSVVLLLTFTYSLPIMEMSI